MSDKTMVSLPVEVARQLEFLDASRTISIQEVIEAYITTRYEEMGAEVDMLDENVKRYSGIMTRFNEEMSAAYDKAYEESEKLWEDFDNRDMSFDKIQHARKMFEPVIDDLETITRLINELDLNKINKLVNALTSLEYMSQGSLIIMAKALGVMREVDEANEREEGNRSAAYIMELAANLPDEDYESLKRMINDG
jgi:hypothetical protein